VWFKAIQSNAKQCKAMKAIQIRAAQQEDQRVGCLLRLFLSLLFDDGDFGSFCWTSRLFHSHIGLRHKSYGPLAREKGSGSGRECGESVAE